MRLGLLLTATVLSFFTKSAFAQSGPQGGGPVTPEHIDVVGHIDRPDRPEVGGNSNAGNNSGGNSPSAAPSPAMKVVGIVTLGPTSYKITAGQADKVGSILSEYRSDMETSNILSTIAVAFQVFNLTSLNSKAPAYDLFLKVVTTDPDQLVDALTVQDPLAKLQRAKTISQIDLLIVNSRDREEAKMWKALRDVFAHPERYREGGIKFTPGQAAPALPGGYRLMLKSDSGGSLRSIAGARLSSDDVACLRYLTNEMMTFGPSRDYTIQADYLLELKFGRLEGLTRRDEMILNRALLSLGPQTKKMLDYRFQMFANAPGLNRTFWSKMRTFLYAEKWEANESGWVDPLANFEREDDLPMESDITRSTPYLLPGPLVW